MIRTITRRSVVSAAVLFGVLAAAGLPAKADWRDQFKEVRFGILSGENEKDRVQRYTAFKNYLERELKVPVKIYTANAYSGVIQALAANQIEFAFLGSSSYAAAWEETNGGVEPLLSRLQKSGSTGYYSVVVVRCDSGYKTIADLKGKTLAFADPNSTSGYAVPYFNLRKQGYDPEKFFGATPFSGSHEAGVLGVYNKQFDAAATNITDEQNGHPHRLVKKGMITPGSVCIIWKSPEITSGPFTARSNLPADLKKQVADLVYDVPQQDPKAFDDMISSDQVGWIRVNHERYAWIVEMRAELRKMRRHRGS